MPTGIPNLWAAMDRDAAAGGAGSAGWLLRLARPTSACPLFAAIELTSRRRAVLLRLPGESVPPRRRWPRCKGLEPVSLRIDGKEHFGVTLKDERFVDVFAALAEDLARRVSEALTPVDQARAFLGQLSRWQKFLTASAEGLTEEEQRGLWGELRCLRERLLPVLGFPAVGGWKGPEQAQQDFQFENGAIEVKATLAKQPQVVRITSERQLDATAWPTLILHIVALDARDGGGETLPGIIASLRSSLAVDPGAQEQFEDRLLLAGYLDAHAGRYADRGYLVRSETSLHVRPGFPVLTESNMPPGIGSVSYGLAVSACAAFSITKAELEEHVVAMTNDGERRKRRDNG
jgi:Putative  PD-(D/E)XK family member, (DUF4420)